MSASHLITWRSLPSSGWCAACRHGYYRVGRPFWTKSIQGEFEGRHKVFRLALQASFSHIGRRRSQIRREETVDKKIVVIGGSGLIGTKLVSKLRQLGHEVVAASPTRASTPSRAKGWPKRWRARRSSSTWRTRQSFEDKAVLEFFEKSGRNLLAAEAAAGVGITSRCRWSAPTGFPESGYLRAKMAQEKLIKESRMPYTILRSTQFFEFVNGIAQSASDGKTIRLSPALCSRSCRMTSSPLCSTSRSRRR